MSDAAPFIALIPARLASSRLPRKPLADLHGLPMVVRVAQRALASGARQAVVATDTPEILQACQAHGIQALLTRADHPSGSDRLAEACDLLQLPDGAIVVNVQGDEPLIDPALVRAVAQLLQDTPSASMGTAAHPITSVEEFLNPNVVKLVRDASGCAQYFSRAPIPHHRDVAPPWWSDSHPHGPLRHIGLYSYRASFLRAYPRLAPSPLEQIESLEQLRALWHGHRIAVHVTEQAPPAGVDTPQDLERVRALLASGFAAS